MPAVAKRRGHRDPAELAAAALLVGHLGVADWTAGEMRDVADLMEREGRGEAAARFRTYAGLAEAPERVELCRQVQAALRRLAQARGRCPVVVVAGGAPPALRGETGKTVFRGSDTVVKFPRAALKAGYRVTYVPSTRRVTVGIGWLIEQGWFD